MAAVTVYLKNPIEQQQYYQVNRGWLHKNLGKNFIKGVKYWFLWSKRF